MKEATREGPPEGFLRVDVMGLIPGPEGHALFLIEPVSHRVLPIWIGRVEAMSIQLRLDRRRFERPLTHDLMDQILERLDAHVIEVHLDAVHEGTFVATLILGTPKGRARFDARPSDAVALALSGRAPIFVAREVLDRAGLSQETLESDPTRLLPGRNHPPRDLDAKSTFPPSREPPPRLAPAEARR